MFYYGAAMEEERQAEEEKKEEEVMEEEAPVAQEAPRTFTSYQIGGRKEDGKPVQIAVTVAVLLVVLLIGWFLSQRLRGPSEGEPTGPAVTETPSPTPIVSKEDIEIEVLNGTGTAGEAAFLRDELEDLGYTKIEVGNADASDYEATVVFFSSGFPSELKDELISALEELYTEVDERTGETGSFDARIITGLRQGVTPKPSPTATPKPTATPSPSPTATPTPTP